MSGQSPLSMMHEAPQHAQKKPRLQIVENVSSQTELRVCFGAPGERSQRCRLALRLWLR